MKKYDLNNEATVSTMLAAARQLNFTLRTLRELQGLGEDEESIETGMEHNIYTMVALLTLVGRSLNDYPSLNSKYEEVKQTFFGLLDRCTVNADEIKDAIKKAVEVH